MEQRAPKRAKKDWQSKCIEKFGLQPAPAQWRDSTSSTDRAWERYYHFRSSLTHGAANDDDNVFMECEYSCHDDKEDWSHQLSHELREQMRHLQKEIFGLMPDHHHDHVDYGDYDGQAVLWDYTPWIGKDLRFKGRNRIGTVTHHAVVWSPFAIPHALRLEHYYHHHSRAYSKEFRVSWSFRFFDFEKESFEASPKNELCSNTWNGVDVIRTQNLTTRTVEQLRSFLFGTSVEASENHHLIYLEDHHCQVSKRLTDLDDYSFLRLLFGSMATFDFGKEHNGDALGHRWSPSEQEFQKMALEGALDGTHIRDASDISLSWLGHRIKKITNTLTWAESYYRPPRTIGDAWGYGSDGGTMSDDGDDDASWWPM